MEEQDANWIEECVELLQQLETLNSGRDFSSQSELREFQDRISRLRSQLTERLSGHRLETEVLTPCLDVAFRSLFVVRKHLPGTRFLLLKLLLLGWCTKGSPLLGRELSFMHRYW